MAASFCGSCGAPASPGGSFCPRCGASYATPSVPTPAQTAVTTTAAPGATPVPTHVVPTKPRITQGMAIVALVLNILLIPGVGSLAGGRTKEGAWQLGLMGAGFLLIFTIIGILIAIPLFIGAWIWGLVTGIQLIQESGQPA